MTRRSVLVVGAGPSGLGCALTLAEGHHDVQLIDRIPVPGGEAGWRSTQIAERVQRVQKAGVILRLGETATRWDGHRLLVAKPGRLQWLRADQMFLAGGLRPGTAADLQITGTRPAGVLAATVAEHLLTTGAALWRQPLIIGSSRWGSRVGAYLSASGVSVRVLTHGGVTIGPPGAETIVATGPIEILGQARVRGVRACIADRTQELACDAVVLAAGPYPNRTVDGAVTDPSPGVTFVQPLDGESVDERFTAGQLRARHWLSTIEGTP